MSNFDQVMPTLADESGCLAHDEGIPSRQRPSCSKNIWSGFFETFSKENAYLSKSLVTFLYIFCYHFKNCMKLHSYYRPRSEGDNVLGSVRPSADTLTAEPFDLRP